MSAPTDPRAATTTAIQVDKWIRRRRLHPPAPVLVEVAVAPARAVATA
jgi:Ca2+-transporting ATPase